MHATTHETNLKIQIQFVQLTHASSALKDSLVNFFSLDSVSNKPA